MTPRARRTRNGENTLHPGVKPSEQRRIFPVNCDNDQLGASGVGPWLHATPKKTLEL
jgi:hypothetical protein